MSEVVNYVCPANGTGIGHHATGIGFGLRQVLGDRLRVHAIYQDHNWTNTFGFLQRTGIFDPNGTTVCFDNLWLTTPFNGVPKIILGPFETTHPIPEPELVFSGVSLVGTFSRWGCEVLQQYLPPEKIFVAPYAFYRSRNGHGLYVPITKAAAIANIGKYYESKGWERLVGFFPEVENTLVFSTVAKVEQRKGFDVVVEELPRLDFPVSMLWIGMNAGVGLRLPQVADYLTREGWTGVESSGYHVFRKKQARLLMLPFYNSELELWKIARASDYFLSPTRGEGWGIGTFEALAQGMRVLSSNVASHTEFVSEKTACVIPHGDLISATDRLTGVRYPGQNPQYWAITNLRETIHRALAMTEDEWRQRQGNAVDLVASYSWEDVGRRILEVMNLSSTELIHRTWSTNSMI